MVTDESIIRTDETIHEPTPEEIEAMRKTEGELYAMGFRPFGYEW